jgi:hypothetical protein
LEYTSSFSLKNGWEKILHVNIITEKKNRLILTFFKGTRIWGMGRYEVVWVGRELGFSIKFLVISNIRKVLHQFCVECAWL